MPELDAGEDFATKIKTFLKEGQLEAAVECFDNAFSHYRWKSKFNDVLDALDVLVATCDEKLLQQWVQNTSGHTLSMHCATLGSPCAGTKQERLRRSID
jgi:uncharacterized protein involved in tolerance to divalent cations